MGIMASLLSTIIVLYCHYKVFTCSNYKGSGERKQSNKLFLYISGIGGIGPYALLSNSNAFGYFGIHLVTKVKLIFQQQL